MPKLSRGPSTNQHRYSGPMAGSLAPSSSNMAYYSTRAQQPVATGYYEAMPATSAQASMSNLAYHDPYAVAPLTIPPTGNVGAVTGPLPAQHRASSGAWTLSDDQALLQARAQGQNWAQIQQNFFPTKTPNACRKRHERLMERKGADDWDTRKMQRMAKQYMSLRKEIWTPLAQRTGEKWNVVEQKCMSNGLKNLQSAARAAARHERLEAGQPIGYDDDSGISGIALTPVDDLDGSYSSPECSSGGGGHSASGSSTASHAAYSTAPMHPQGSYQGYYGHHQQQQQHHHGYTSSVSSLATAQGPSQGGSPYMGHGGRLPSADMGIDAIINRPGGGAVHHHQ